jgi:anti-sigma-K factor RskA
MSTPDQPKDDLRCAEYALGVLDSDSRRALEREASRDASLRRTMEIWLARLSPLADDLRDVEPPAHVWTRIQRDLGFLAASTSARGGWWDNLNLWRWLGIGASAAALVLVVMDLMTLREGGPPASVVAQNGYRVAAIARSDGLTHWTATIDVQRARMVVVPVVNPKIAAGRSTELWLIPSGAKPISLGIFPSDAPASIPLPRRILAQMSKKAVLAVSLEPLSGSPTGQPTGPVLATGEIHPT